MLCICVCLNPQAPLFQRDVNSEKTVEETLDQKDEADARKKRYSGQRALLEDKARVTF